MQKHAAVLVFIFAALIVLMSPSGLVRSEWIKAPFPAIPTAVPGSELRRNVATPKAGYEFVNRNQSVDVVQIRTSRVMGKYVCPCNRSDGTGTCELVFRPQEVTCKGGSCTGESCVLTAASLTMHQ